MPNFLSRKTKILAQLAIPETEYTDLSPKGSVDEGVRELCEEINSQEGLVTTSSCAGRVAVFLEGGANVSKTEHEGREDENAAATMTAASSGGKGGGGRWLYVSHDPIEEGKLEGKGEVFKLFGIEEREGEDSNFEAAASNSLPRFVHFKFEPMILHILTSSIQTAQNTLSAAQTSGFRESGISSITGADPTPMVAIRTQGLALDSIIGYEDPQGRIVSTVSESYLRTLVKIANQRFAVNTERKERFRRALLHSSSESDSTPADWEPVDVRRERKRAEGLRRREEMRKKEAGGNATNGGGIEDDEDYSTGLLPLDPP